MIAAASCTSRYPVEHCESRANTSPVKPNNCFALVIAEKYLFAKYFSYKKKGKSFRKKVLSRKIRSPSPQPTAPYDNNVCKFLRAINYLLRNLLKHINVVSTCHQMALQATYDIRYASPPNTISFCDVVHDTINDRDALDTLCAFFFLYYFYYHYAKYNLLPPCTISL